MAAIPADFMKDSAPKSATEGICLYFQSLKDDILWPSELTSHVANALQDVDNEELSINQVIAVLRKKRILAPVEFTSAKYPSILRYVRGSPPPYNLALSLRRDSYLSHRTALAIHDLEPPTKTIYANQEQSPKPKIAEITQQGIQFAFRNKQRQSNFVFQNAGIKYVLLSGKNTSQAGVVGLTDANGTDLRVTDLERTLIDIVVRPAYAGGIERIALIYKKVAKTIDSAHLVDLLKKIGHAYPYHQSIGFLLERSGARKDVLRPFEEEKTKYDFFLDYGMKRPAYNKKWRLYYPKSLV